MKLPDELRTNAAALNRGQKEDPVELDLVGKPLDGEAPDRLPVHLDDPVGLGLSASHEASPLIGVVPRAVRLLDVGPKGNLEELKEELEVFGGGGSESDLVAHAHAA